jgi:hypothetical protein
MMHGFLHGDVAENDPSLQGVAEDPPTEQLLAGEEGDDVGKSFKMGDMDDITSTSRLVDPAIAATFDEGSAEERLFSEEMPLDKSSTILQGQAPSTAALPADADHGCLGANASIKGHSSVGEMSPKKELVGRAYQVVIASTPKISVNSHIDDDYLKRSVASTMVDANVQTKGQIQDNDNALLYVIFAALVVVALGLMALLFVNYTRSPPFTAFPSGPQSALDMPRKSASGSLEPMPLPLPSSLFRALTCLRRSAVAKTILSLFLIICAFAVGFAIVLAAAKIQTSQLAQVNIKSS